ncbi:MAG: hypothetical protein MZV64_13970 [Ignavibacteriales bacterium]|nr:hypothetical protein [Ignavibacteriales bacterium]
MVEPRRQLHLPRRRLPSGATRRAGPSIDAGLRRPDDDPLLLPGHEPRPRRRARREGLPRASSSPAPASGHVNKPLYPAHQAGHRAGRPRRDDGADALGLRPDVRLRHRARPARPRHRPARQHAARDGAHEALRGCSATPTTTPR